MDSVVIRVLNGPEASCVCFQLEMTLKPTFFNGKLVDEAQLRKMTIVAKI